MPTFRDQLFSEEQPLSISDEPTETSDLNDLYEAEEQVSENEEASKEKYGDGEEESTDDFSTEDEMDTMQHRLDLADVAVFDNDVAPGHEPSTEDEDSISEDFGDSGDDTDDMDEESSGDDDTLEMHGSMQMKCNFFRDLFK